MVWVAAIHLGEKRRNRTLIGARVWVHWCVHVGLGVMCLCVRKGAFHECMGVCMGKLEVWVRCAPVIPLPPFLPFEFVTIMY